MESSISKEMHTYVYTYKQDVYESINKYVHYTCIQCKGKLEE